MQYVIKGINQKGECRLLEIIDDKKSADDRLNKLMEAERYVRQGFKFSVTQLALPEE
jgi:hypothetical protein